MTVHLTNLSPDTFRRQSTGSWQEEDQLLTVEGSFSRSQWKSCPRKFMDDGALKLMSIQLHGWSRSKGQDSETSVHSVDRGIISSLTTCTVAVRAQAVWMRCKLPTCLHRIWHDAVKLEIMAADCASVKLAHVLTTASFVATSARECFC